MLSKHRLGTHEVIARRMGALVKVEAMFGVEVEGMFGD